MLLCSHTLNIFLLNLNPTSICSFHLIFLSMRMIFAALTFLLVLVPPLQCQQTAEEWLENGTNLAGQARYNESLQAFEQAIALDSNSTLAWVSKGAALLSLGRCKDALEAQNEAIRLNPTFAAAWHYRGKSLECLDREDEALKAYEEAIRLDSGNAGSWNDKGN